LHKFSRPLGLKWGFGEYKVWGDIDPNELVLGVLTPVPILMKIYQEMRPWECSQTDTQTDANPICPMLKL